MSWILLGTTHTEKFIEKNWSDEIRSRIFRVRYYELETDNDIHDFIFNAVEQNKDETEGFILPISLGAKNDFNIKGLDLALHLRLSYKLGNIRKIPIILLSNITETNILKYCVENSSNNAQMIFFTPGIELVGFETCEVEKRINKMTTLTDVQYNEFLDRINVQRKITYGHHDIGNAWGCYKMATLLDDESLLDTIEKNQKVSKYLKKLYTKYLICKSPYAYLNQKQNKKTVLNKVKIQDKKPKILYIDDKADEGWSDIMRYIFRECDFHYVDPSVYKSHVFNYEKFQDESFHTCCSQRWDLVLIDLRLDPEHEDVDHTVINPTNLSGYQLMAKMLEKNAGYQIMFVTASNKAWNITEILRGGACGYFIKESPEHSDNLSSAVNRYNSFIDNVNHCLEYSYLYDIYEQKKELVLNVEKWNIFENDEKGEFKLDLINFINTSWALFSKSINISFQKNIDYESVGYSYQSLEFFLEHVAKKFIETDTEENHRYMIFKKDIVESYKLKSDEKFLISYKVNGKFHKIEEQGMYDSIKIKDHGWTRENSSLYMQIFNILEKCWHCPKSDLDEYRWNVYDFINARNVNTHKGEDSRYSAKNPRDFLKLMIFLNKLATIWDVPKY